MKGIISIKTKQNQNIDILIDGFKKGFPDWAVFVECCEEENIEMIIPKEVDRAYFESLIKQFGEVSK